jgi:hypothetical protein
MRRPMRPSSEMKRGSAQSSRTSWRCQWSRPGRVTSATFPIAWRGRLPICSISACMSRRSISRQRQCSCRGTGDLMEMLHTRGCWSRSGRWCLWLRSSGCKRDGRMSGRARPGADLRPSVRCARRARRAENGCHLPGCLEGRGSNEKGPHNRLIMRALFWSGREDLTRPNPYKSMTCVCARSSGNTEV